jgi:alanine racemase
MYADSTLDIDLGAIARNAASFRSMCGPRTALCGVIKADAYGLGAHAVAQVLVGAGWDMLAVHRIDEALALLGSISRPIVVLGPVRGLTPLHPLADALARGAVQLSVHDAAAMDDVLALGQVLGRPIGVHLELDTGMGRGVSLAEAPALIRTLLGDPRVSAKGVMTHFAASADRARTTKQYTAFDRALLPFRRRLPMSCLRHAAATTAMLRHPDTRADMVRIGLGWVGLALGIDAPRVDGDLLEPAVRWHTTMVSVRRVPAGTRLGYGSHHVCAHDARIAMLPVGYADGLPVHARGLALRVLDEAHHVVGEAPIIGTVAMDQILLDISALPASMVGVGTRVEMFGPDTLGSFAAALGLQPHHLLTAIGPRVHRRLLTSRSLHSTAEAATG